MENYQLKQYTALPVTVETYVAYETFFPVSIFHCVDQFTPTRLFQMHLSLLGAMSSRPIRRTVMSFERHGVSSQRQFECLFNHLVRLTPKTISKFSITCPLWVEYIQQFPHKGSVLEWRQISVMSNHRRLGYSFNSLSRLSYAIEINMPTVVKCISAT